MSGPNQNKYELQYRGGENSGQQFVTPEQAFKLVTDTKPQQQTFAAKANIKFVQTVKLRDHNVSQGTRGNKGLGFLCGWPGLYVCIVCPEFKPPEITVLIHQLACPESKRRGLFKSTEHRVLS
eukprot:COSAG02_NODE_1292_length_13424_cov_31.074597_4_plen_123_part_00